MQTWSVRSTYLNGDRFNKIGLGRRAGGAGCPFLLARAPAFSSALNSPSSCSASSRASINRSPALTDSKDRFVAGPDSLVAPWGVYFHISREKYEASSVSEKMLAYQGACSNCPSVRHEKSVRMCLVSVTKCVCARVPPFRVPICSKVRNLSSS